MGFQTGNILEPSMGVSNFFGLLPEAMQGSRLYGVELDSITGCIARKLYPEADINVAGFQTTDRRDFYAPCVGNVPCGDYKVNDKPHIQGQHQAAEPDVADISGATLDKGAIPADPDVKNFSYALVDGEVYFRENSVMKPVELNDTAKGRVAEMFGLRQIVNDLIEYQLEDYPDGDIQAKQVELNAAYDAFYAKYGTINSSANARVFDDDSAYGAYPGQDGGGRHPKHECLCPQDGAGWHLCEAGFGGCAPAYYPAPAMLQQSEPI